MYYGGIHIVYCPECGNKNEGNASFCKNCGIRIKPNENKNEISKLINLKAIIIGIVTYFVVAVMLVIFLDVTGMYNGFNIDSAPLPYVFIISISSIITGFFSGGKYLNGIFNSIIIAIFYSIVYFVLSGLLLWFVDALILFGVFGLVGGLIGVLIYRNYKNYNLFD